MVSNSDGPTVTELDALRWGQHLSGPIESSTVLNHGVQQDSQHPLREASGQDESVLVIAATLKSPYMNRWRAAACLLGYFTQGLNDSVVGALLPYMEDRYNISYGVISLLFLANALGFLTAGPFTHRLNNWLGRSKSLSLCASLNLLAYVAIVARPPYPVVVVSFYVLGYGFATILALNNVFILNLQHGIVLLGVMHGFYGIGGTTAPFIATAMVSKGIEWFDFYTIPLTLSAIGAVSFYLSFRGYENRGTQTHVDGILRKAFTNRTTLLGSVHLFAYQGAEVSISGWVISFLITYRDGNPSHVGYVTAGFWGGITLGRFLLVTPAHKVGDRISVAILVGMTAAFQLLLWFVPYIVGNAVAVAVIGLLLGPIAPCAAGVFNRLLPSHLQITSLGLISAGGSSGGAFAPFFTGILGQKLGIVVLNPICLVLYAVMAVSWLTLPRSSKRSE